MPGGNLEQEILRAQGKGQLLPQPPIPMPPGVSLKVLDAIARGISYTGNPVVDQYLAQTWPQIEVPRHSIHADTTYQSAPVLYPPDTAPTDPENGATAGPTAPASEPPKPVFITDTPSTYTTTLSLTGTSSDVKYVFYIPPESIEISIPSRVGTYQSIGGGSYFDHLGEGIATISISGHTGFRRGIGKPEGSLTMGYAQYVLLKDIISKYNDECVMGNADKINLRLSISLPDSPAFGQWDVVVKDLNLKRNTQSVLLFRYSLTLLCVSKNRMEIARPAQAITRQAPDPPVYVAKPDQVKVAPAQAGPTGAAGAAEAGVNNGAADAAARAKAEEEARARAKADAEAAKSQSRVHVPSQIWQYKVPALTGLKTSIYIDKIYQKSRTIMSNEKISGTVDFLGGATGNKLSDFFQGPNDPSKHFHYATNNGGSDYKLKFVIPITVDPEIVQKFTETTTMIITVFCWDYSDAVITTNIPLSFIPDDLELLNQIFSASANIFNTSGAPDIFDINFLLPSTSGTSTTTPPVPIRYIANNYPINNPKKYLQNNTLILRPNFIIPSNIYNLYDTNSMPNGIWSKLGFAAVVTFWNNIKPNAQNPNFPVVLFKPSSSNYSFLRSSSSLTFNSDLINYNATYIGNNPNISASDVSQLFSFYPTDVDKWATVGSIAVGNFYDLTLRYENTGIVTQRKDPALAFSHQYTTQIGIPNDKNNIEVLASKGNINKLNSADYKSFSVTTADVHVEQLNTTLAPKWTLQTKPFVSSSMLDQTEFFLLQNFLFIPDKNAEVSKKYTLGLTQGDINFAPPRNMVELVNDFYGVNYNDPKHYNDNGINTVYSAIVSAIIEENQGKGNLFLDREQIWPEGTIINLPNMIDGIDYNIDSSRLGAVLGQNSGGYFTTKAYTVSSGDASAGSDY